MLGKLLKYEWKSMGRSVPWIYLAIVAVALCIGLSLRKIDFSSDGIGLAIFIAAYFILIMVLVVITVVTIIQRFFNSMVGSEGYLMHTLPAKTWQHIICKLIMAIIWAAIAIIVIMGSGLLLLWASGGLTEIVTALLADPEFLMFWDMFGIFGDLNMGSLIWVSVLSGIRCILMVYAAIAIGGSATKNKIVYSFVAFIVMAVITSAIGTIVSTICGLGMSEALMMDAALNSAGSSAEFIATWNNMVNGAFAAQLIMDGILVVVFFLLTNYFLKKRLNLE